VIFLTITALPDSDAPDRVGDGGAVDDRAVDDAVRRNRLAAERRHSVGLAGGLQLDRLDGARADVQADQGFRSAKHRGCPIVKTDASG
jgi:hypothetical protein